ncbi:MAG: hypothetical protein JO368_02565, partial [Acidimicrobiales bacterium]|nr:hypothetical protein [Acidimicrobiales bacterium]
MKLVHSGRVVAVGVTGVLAIAGVAAGALAATPAGVAVRSGQPGLVALVGVGWVACGDNNKTQ